MALVSDEPNYFGLYKWTEICPRCGKDLVWMTDDPELGPEEWETTRCEGCGAEFTLAEAVNA